MNTQNKYKSQAADVIRSYEDDLYYKNRFISSVLAKHIESEKTRDKIQIVCLPIIRLITDSISCLYNKKVIRTLNNDDESIKELFGEVEKSFDKKSVLVDKYTKLSGMLALKNHYDSELDKLEFVIYDSSMIHSYAPNALDYSKYEELIIDYYFDNVKQEEIWDRTTFSRKVDGSRLETLANDYNFIPITLFKDKDLANSFYVAPATNLLDFQDFITNQLVQIGQNFKFQSMSMLVVKGGGELQSMNFGASAVNQVGSEDSIDFINPTTDLSLLVETLNSELQLFSRANGIPDSLLTASSTSSGVAITISQKILDEYVEQRAKQFIDFEKETLIKGLKVLGYHRNVEIPEDIDVNIKYLSIFKQNKLTSEDIAMNEFYLKNDIYTKVDIMLQVNPNMSREEAESKIKENSKFNKEFGVDIETNNSSNINDMKNESDNNK